MKKFKHVLASLLLFALMFTSFVPGAAAAHITGSKFDLLHIGENTQVTAIVILEEDGLIDVDRNLGSVRAKRAETTMRGEQSDFVSRLKGRMDVTVLYRYTVLADGVSIRTSYKNLKAVESMPGVKGVYLENIYSLPETQMSRQSQIYNDMTGANWMHAQGYNGDGMVIAVLDTGIRLTHEVFADYGLARHITLSSAAIAALGTSVPGKWVSNRIPFAYDYADKDNDVTPKNTHGTHVAGIAAGYAETEEGAILFSGSAPAAQLLAMKVFADDSKNTGSSIYFAALEDAYRLGADVINMSLGAVGGYSYDAELESRVFGNIYQKLRDAGIVVSVSTGNAGSMGDNAANPISQILGRGVYADYVDYGVVGSPASYESNLAVASVECAQYPGDAIEIGGEQFAYSDGAPDPLRFFTCFAGQSLNYVMVPDYGVAGDFTGIGVSGKVAVIARGEIDFQTKIQNAADAGAIAALVCNTTDEGLISMRVDSYIIPAIFVTQEAGTALAENAQAGKLIVPSESGTVPNPSAWQMSRFSSWGTTSDLRLKPELTAPGGMINSASSAGDSAYMINNGTSMAAPNVAGAMASLMQFVSADIVEEYLPGDANRDRVITAADAALILRYIVKLETMDQEQLLRADIVRDSKVTAADAAFILRGIVKLETLPEVAQKTGDKRERAKTVRALALSTAAVLTDGEGVPYSPRLQGAGMVELSNAGSADAYIVQPLLELGDDKTRTGEFNMSFDVANLTDVPQSYKITPQVIRDHADEIEGTYYNPLSAAGANFSFSVSGAADKVITVPAGGKCKVELSVQLTAEEKSELNTLFKNGTFIEGFIMLKPTDEGQPIHATFLGFYGDWAAQPILEEMDFGDVLNAKYELENTTELADKSYQDLLRLNIGFNKAYTNSTNGEVDLLGANTLVPTVYDENRNAISNKNSNAPYLAMEMTAYPMQLRNTRRLIMLVTDAVTGALYYVDDTPYLRKAYYDSEKEAYQPGGVFFWDGADDKGKFVPNDTEVKISYYAWLDYEKDVEVKFKALNGDYKKLSTDAYWEAKCVWEYPLTVDCAAPVIDPNVVVSNEGKTLTLTVSDNQFIMGVVLTAPDGAVQTQGVITVRGGSATVTFDLTGIAANAQLKLEVVDYATNRPEYAYNLATGELRLA